MQTSIASIVACAVLCGLGCGQAHELGVGGVAEPLTLDAGAADGGASDGGFEPPIHPLDPTRPVGYWTFDDCRVEKSDLADSAQFFHDARLEAEHCSPP